MFERSKYIENDEWMRDRDKLLFPMMWATGARITDVLNMNSDLIDFKNRTIEFLVKKCKDRTREDGQFWHTVTLAMEILSEIMNYMQTWRIRGYLFRSYRNKPKPLTRRG